MVYQVQFLHELKIRGILETVMKLSGPIELIKKSFKIFFKKENLTYFLKIYAPLLPFAIIGLLQENYINFDSQSLPGQFQFIDKYTWLALLMLIVGLLGIVLSFWVNASGILAADGVLRGKRLSVKEIFRITWKMLFRFSVLNIAIGLIVGVGLIFLIVPGVIFLVLFYFAMFELVTKGIGIREAMNNSKVLVKGKFWKVFGRVLIFGGFSILTSIIFDLTPFGLGSILTTLLGALFIIPALLLYEELDGSTRNLR
ncbi:MAG: hypothetical protein UU12_C0004G0023 [Candidatus Woesebacteria bacterium GW2011_GWA2_40_7b]|uniref:Glycerophosphoryl diester phosphodiesterase membrane domain-containing protein n=1 Tax=Candidatus Woesebacteria bacterium GW2011_GWA2_40_7b TaxID=1618563 RepID=A0A0G0T922_9BACT|nr:MAG: hypothetical protein UU12_C0004G0023 [Candidatus Woesebacteria bacterium GW2011_GWA2_40_7b]